jgi:hypothetical protein
LNYRATNKRRNWKYLTLYPTNIKRNKRTCCLGINLSVEKRKGRGCAKFDDNGDKHFDDEENDDDDDDDDAHNYEDDSNNCLFPSTMP